MPPQQQISNSLGLTKEKGNLDNFWDYVQFEHNDEKLVFKRIPNSSGQEGILFGLFKNNGTQLGISFCRLDRFKGEAWYLDDLQIFPEFRGKGYGTQLLEQTCDALWRRELKDIVLERPSNTASPNGFDRKAWYERHGFEPHPDPKNTFMWRKAPTISTSSKLLEKFKIVVEKHSDGYVAYPIGIVGAVVGQGDSYEEALTDVTSALACYIYEFGDNTLADSSPIEVFFSEVGIAI